MSSYVQYQIRNLFASHVYVIEVSVYGDALLRRLHFLANSRSHDLV
jgi:hypothetical protein